MTPLSQLFIATPMYGGQCSGQYTQSLLSLCALLPQHGIASLTAFVFNESLVTRARNALAHSFLQSQATHLLFIDADIHFIAEDVPPMVAANVPVLCGIYPKKRINWEGVRAAALRKESALQHFSGTFAVNLVGDTQEMTVPVNQPVEIASGGTGFMLIQRQVFELLAPSTPTYWDDSNEPPLQMREFFATSIDPQTQRLLSEDYHFCHRWRAQGGKVHAAPWVRLGHVGSYVFEGALQRS
jgi:hypothetical protein